jgi:hypothetical protein
VPVTVTGPEARRRTAAMGRPWQGQLMAWSESGEGGRGDLRPGRERGRGCRGSVSLRVSSEGVGPGARFK